MTISVKVGEAKTRLSELLAKVEAGEEVIISRGDQPIAKLMRLTQEPDVQAAIDQYSRHGSGANRRRPRKFELGETRVGGFELGRRCLDRNLLDLA